MQYIYNVHSVKEHFDPAAIAENISLTEKTITFNSQTLHIPQDEKFVNRDQYYKYNNDNNFGRTTRSFKTKVKPILNCPCVYFTLRSGQ